MKSGAATVVPRRRTRSSRISRVRSRSILESTGRRRPPDKEGIEDVRRPVVNITPRERAGRILVGLSATVAGLVLLASATAAGVVALEILLVLAGLDLAVTGALGHCPLYQRLGHVPPSLRRPA
jgi:hypothetical protein